MSRILFHGQAGTFGFKAAPARPDKVRALIAVETAGGSADVVDLPKAGMTGNSHMMMMDKNNTEVAAPIQTWLEGKGLAKKP